MQEKERERKKRIKVVFAVTFYTSRNSRRFDVGFTISTLLRHVFVDYAQKFDPKIVENFGAAVLRDFAPAEYRTRR